MSQVPGDIRLHEGNRGRPGEVRRPAAATGLRAGASASVRTKQGARPPTTPRQARPPPPPPRGKPAPPARSRRKILAIVGTAACGVVVLTAVWMFVFQTAPIVKEKLWIAALYSRIPPVQQVAIKALRNYPTKHA